MDIVRRAYFKVLEEVGSDQETFDLQVRVKGEVTRLIKARAYSGRDWPREWGPIPDELRSKR